VENKDKWQKPQSAQEEFVNTVIETLAECLVPFLKNLNTALLHVNRLIIDLKKQVNIE
jgi:hypothetical protein